MTAWIVEVGEYSERRTLAVFTDEDRAKLCAEAWGGIVSERALDPEPDSALPEHSDIYEVEMTRTGDGFACEDWRDPNELWAGYDSCGNLEVIVRANSRDHAVKIANDRRAFILANDLWGKELRRDPRCGIVE